MLSPKHTVMLKHALQGTGFVRRGAAFFRVWGDGVLQVVKFEFHNIYEVRDLSVAVFSMYGELNPDIFTPCGCNTRNSVAHFVGLRCVNGYLSPESFSKADNGQFFYNGFAVSVDPSKKVWDNEGAHWKYHLTPQQQIQILTQKVLPWLNRVENQSLAAKVMYELDPIPNDRLRFDAHLAAGEWDEAEQTMAAILKQHRDAQASWERTFSKEKFVEMVAHQEPRTQALKSVYAMVQETNTEAIYAYLSSNYRKNYALAEFCVL